VCTELQEAVRHDPNFLSRVVTGDESWLYDYDPERKQQSSHREDCCVTEKSAPNLQQHQVDADLFFIYLRNCA
jgi:hypothetical protein